MSTYHEEAANMKSSHVERIAEQLTAAEDSMRDARYSGDTRAFGYAEQKVIRLRRELAKTDPRGAGHKYRLTSYNP